MLDRMLVAALGLLWPLVAAPSIPAQTLRPLSKADKPGALADQVAPSILDCTGAVDVQLGDMVCSNNLGAANDVDHYGCSPWPETGGEVVYRLTLASPAAFEIRLDSSCDLDLAILSACDADAGCLLVADTGITATELVTGTFFVVVDGYNGAACDFCLDFVETEPSGPPDPTACAAAQPLSCTARVETGTTCGAGNDVEQADCAIFDEKGEDAWYRIGLNADGYVTVNARMVDADVALWLLDGCGPGFQCLAYADADTTGEPEVLTYSNPGDQPQTLFLVVDTFLEPMACASYELEIVQCVHGVVADGTASWSTFKSRFAGPSGQEGR
jgi:hypothetical protein